MPADRPEGQSGPPSSGDTGIPPEELKKAYQAFKKRLKLTRLDDESRLGHRATTSGGKSSGRSKPDPLFLFAHVRGRSLGCFSGWRWRVSEYGER